MTTLTAIAAIALIAIAFGGYAQALWVLMDILQGRR